jgi:hypothetical protein
VVAAEPADRALDAALLVCPLDAGLAVERVEPVVRGEQDPAGVLVASPAGTLDDLGDCGGQVVVLDVAGRTPPIASNASMWPCGNASCAWVG